MATHGLEAPAAPAAGVGEWTESGSRKRKKGYKDNLPKSNQGTSFIHFWKRPPKVWDFDRSGLEDKGVLSTFPKGREDSQGKGQGARLTRFPHLATHGKGGPEEDSAVLHSRRQTDLEQNTRGNPSAV